MATHPQTTNEWDDIAIQALSNEGAMCGDCGDQPGDRICPDCERCRKDYVAALRAAGWAPRVETFNQGAEVLEQIVQQVEARVAEYYGAASGIGPGSAEMVREAAGTLRDLAKEADYRCPHCKGSRLDPDNEGDWIPDLQRHDPNTIGPCPKCQGTGRKP